MDLYYANIKTTKQAIQGDDYMPNRKDKYWDQCLNDWDGDATD